MTIWLDAHLPPAAAPWVAATFGVTATHVRDLGLRQAQDPPIFAAARAASAVVMTKDSDFADLVRRHGTPPQVLWFRCGNTSNAELRRLLAAELPDALARLTAGEPVVELGVAG
jgi:predicted nuclease of predicted toxin-antitoxin system